MSYCVNPTCQEPQNSDLAECCQACGSNLLLQNRYRPLKLLGQGGFGRTFLAVEAAGDRGQGTENRDEGVEIEGWGVGDTASKASTLCVIKQLLPQPVADIRQQAIAFQQEALRLTELGQHPQIPTLLDHFQQNQQFYLVQAWVDGTNLAIESAQAAFSEAKIWQLLEDLLPVLKFIHDRQVIHRDIKPENMIRPRSNGRLVLVDFGAAKLVSSGDFKTGTSIGSAEYVAPEQAKGKAVFASDLYSLGTTCLHLLTQLSPFDLFDSVSDRWVWRNYLATSIDDRLGQILDQLIQSALNRRFHSVEAVLQAISSDQQPVPSHHSIPLVPYGQRTLTVSGSSTSVNAIAVSPNGETLVSGSEDQTIRQWLKTGKIVQTFSGHIGAVRSVAIAPQGHILASSGDDKTIRLWNLNTGQALHTLHGHQSSVRSLAFSPDGQWLASGSWDKTIKLWNISTGTELTLRQHKLQIAAVAFSPDGQFLASASCDRTVQLWQVDLLFQAPPQLRWVLRDHAWAVLAVAFSPDSTLLATGSDDRTLKLWHINTGELIRTMDGHSWSVVAIAFSPDGKTLASGSWDKTIKLWQVETGQQIASLSGHTDSICAVAFTPDGGTIASSSKDGTIKLWHPNL